MASPYIRMIALRQFAVPGAHLSQTDLSLEMEQAVFRLEMERNSPSHSHILSVMEHWAAHEGFRERRPYLKVELEECFERIR